MIQLHHGGVTLQGGVPTPAEAAEIVKTIYASGYPDRMVLQKMVPGGDDHMRVLTAFSDENTSLEAAFASGSGPVACSVASLVHDPRASAADRSSRLHKVVVLVIIL